jgi:DNA recombination protein RmuC
MAIEVAVLAAALAVAVVALAIVVTRRSGDGRRLAAQEAEIAAARALTETARNESIQRLADKIAAETRLADLQRQLAVLTAERNDAAAAREAALAAESAALRELAVMRQQLGDFERLKEESLKSNQAAVFETAQQVSSKLLEDHKRENEEAKKTGEALVRQTTEQLFKQFHDVAQSLNQLEGRVTTDGQKIETVLRALSNPSGAGQFAEVLLANTLKSFGLEERRDFLLQHTTEDAETGQRLRPDALVFLPGNNLLVIDCKASKFVMELAEAEGTEAEEMAYQNLSRTMNQHLKALASKDYRGAVEADFRNSGRSGGIARVWSVMYLPNDGAIEKLHQVDPEFTQRATGRQIIPTSRAGLACILSFVSTEVNLGRQIENRDQIVETTRDLLDSIAKVLEHALSLGRGIKIAAENYEKLTGSVNRFLLPRARRLAQLGVQPNKQLPGNLTAYRVERTESIIEGDAEDITEPTPPIAVLIKQAGD